ncbi:MAG: lysophospholipase [Clostridiales bacterium]|nr:lysophospholipase [Clostridiales bacterium]
MKILFYGDSITDMGRDRENEHPAFKMGIGYPNFIAGALAYENPEKYEFVNRGISGNRVVDLYARIKEDVWNHEPDVLSILIGINDVWHEIGRQGGVDIVRWEKVYRMLIEDTLARLPNVKIIICEPFVLKESATSEQWKEFLTVKEYAKVAKKLAKEYGLTFVPLQAAFDEVEKAHGAGYYLFDGVHPTAAGAKLIATEWLKAFQTKIN